MEQKTWDLLETADWDNITVRLLDWVVYRFNLQKNKTMGKGVTPKDIVYGSIEKVLDGKKQWDPQKGELLPFLKMVVKSETLNFLDSAEYRKTQRDILLEEAEQGGPIYKLPHLPNPEDNFLEREFFANLEESAEGDEVVESLILCVMEGITKASEVAEELGMDVKKVYNAKRRFRRLMDSFLKDLSF